MKWKEVYKTERNKMLVAYAKDDQRNNWTFLIHYGSLPQDEEPTYAKVYAKKKYESAYQSILDIPALDEDEITEMIHLLYPIEEEKE